MSNSVTLPGKKGKIFEVAIEGDFLQQNWVEYDYVWGKLIFQVDPNMEQDKRWHIIGDLEFADTNITGEEKNRYGYRFSKYLNAHCYSIACPGGLDDASMFCSHTYISVIEAIKYVLGINDDGLQDTWAGSTLFRRKLTSTCARFIGQKGWFNLI